MTQALRVYDKENRIIYLSEALDYSNVFFQLAHVLCLIEFQDLLNKLTAGTKITVGTSLSRCHVELANYFAAAYLMPYEPFLREAESMAYDKGTVPLCLPRTLPAETAKARECR